MEQKQIILSKYMSREHSLFYAHVWNEANRDLFDNLVPETNVKNMIFALNPSKVLDVYYDLKELGFAKMSKAFVENPELVDQIIKEFYIYWNKLLPYVTNKKTIRNTEDLREYYNNWVHWWASMAFVFVIPDKTDIPQDLKQKAMKVRVETQQYSDDGDRIFAEFIEKHYPQYSDIAHLLIPEEAFRIDKLTKSEIQIIRERKNGCALLTLNRKSRLISLKDINKEVEKEDMQIEKVVITPQKELTGLSASPGIVKGSVRLILKKADLALIKKGEIMVTYATSPEYVPAMKKSAGIITDEGGIVCHASIVSRELGIPCVVGTKVGTQVLKDGMEIELNATKGVIKILNSNNNENNRKNQGK